MVSPKYYQRLARRLLVDHLATAVRSWTSKWRFRPNSLNYQLIRQVFPLILSWWPNGLCKTAVLKLTPVPWQKYSCSSYISQYISVVRLIFDESTYSFWSENKRAKRNKRGRTGLVSPAGGPWSGAKYKPGGIFVAKYLPHHMPEQELAAALRSKGLSLLANYSRSAR